MLDVAQRMVSQEKPKVPKSKREVPSSEEGTSSKFSLHQLFIIPYTHSP